MLSCELLWLLVCTVFWLELSCAVLCSEEPCCVEEPLSKGKLLPALLLEQKIFLSFDNEIYEPSHGS